MDGAQEKERMKRKRKKSLDGSKNGKPSKSLKTSDSTDETGSIDKSAQSSLKSYRISKTSRKILKSKGIAELFPIQYMTFDAIYDRKDVIGQARTGTGKTLSFVLPLVEKLSKSDITSNLTVSGRPPVVLVLAPTRELANQVYGDFTLLAGSLSVYCIYGGVPYWPQESAMRKGLDIVVGTPGRILDHVNKGNLSLSQLQCVILDEADQMLEIGFADTMDEILAACYHEGHTKETNCKPQLLLFSATIPSWVQDTANKYMSSDRVIVDLVGRDTVRTAVNVQHKAICCQRSERPSLICDIISVYSGSMGKTMLFTSTKAEANELALSSLLKQECQVLHGDIPQQQREVTLKSFREGKFPVLVATDVAARGLDIPEVDLVIQCEPPTDVDAYIHRSGRTGRAGRSGTCVMLYRPNEEYMILRVEKKARITVQRVGGPRSSDIVKAASDDAIKCIQSVSDNVIDHFKSAATQLIEEKGAEMSLCAALAYISGFTQLTNRSLLNSEQGYTTFMLTGHTEVRGPGYFWKIIERKFGEENKSAVKGLRMCNDNKGVVFDVPNSITKDTKDICGTSYGITLSIPESLPDLKPRPQDYYQKQQSRARNFHWSRGRSMARGGRGYRTFGGRH